MGNTCEDCNKRGAIESEGAISYSISEATDPRVMIQNFSVESPSRIPRKQTEECMTPGLASKHKDLKWDYKKFLKLKKILDKKFTRSASTPNLSKHSQPKLKTDQAAAKLDELLCLNNTQRFMTECDGITNEHTQPSHLRVIHI